MEAVKSVVLLLDFAMDKASIASLIEKALEKKKIVKVYSMELVRYPSDKYADLIVLGQEGSASLGMVKVVVVTVSQAVVAESNERRIDRFLSQREMTEAHAMKSVNHESSQTTDLIILGK